MFLEAALSSFLIVFLGEMGDKTQLLALVLAFRYRKPWVILAGIFAATLLNHALAASLGTWIAAMLSPTILRIGLAALFFLFAAWILIPDGEQDCPRTDRFGPFLTTTCAFFLAEMGDKTQLATVALGAQFSAPWIVTAATTFGLVAANAPVVFWGQIFLKKIPLVWVHRAAAASFTLFGLIILLGI